MQRTPPRRSSRLQKPPGNTPTNLNMSHIDESPSASISANDASIAAAERSTLSSPAIAAAVEKGAPSNTATTATTGRSVPSHAAAEQERSVAVKSTTKKGVTTSVAITTVTESRENKNAAAANTIASTSSATSQYEAIILAMQKQIASLEYQLKYSQVSPQNALQNNTQPSSSVSPPTYEPPTSVAVTSVPIPYDNAISTFVPTTYTASSSSVNNYLKPHATLPTYSSLPAHAPLQPYAPLPTNASLPAHAPLQPYTSLPAHASLHAQAPLPTQVSLSIQASQSMSTLLPTQHFYSSATMLPSTSMPTVYATLPSSNPYSNVAAIENAFSNGLQCQVSTATPSNLYFQPPSRNSIDSHSFTRLQPNPAYMQNVTAPRKVQDLPSFCGHPEDWPIFYSAFMQSTAAYSYTNLENNQRLQKCLTGEARETVKSLLIHPDNVGAIIDQLRFRFGRPDQLIRSQLKLVREIAPIPENAVERLIPFSTKTKNLAVFLQSVNGQQHLANPTLLEELVLKLPMSKRVDWARYAAQIQPYPTIVSFSDWLSDLANIICTVQNIEVREPKRRIILHAAKMQANTPKCCICQGQHIVTQCNVLIESSVPERWSKVKTHRLCFNCLKAGHSTRVCRNRSLCTVNGCQKRHHTLLHEQAIFESAPKLVQAEVKGAGEAVLSCALNEIANSNLLFRVVPVTLYGQDKTIDTYALLDEGSSVTMLDNSLVKELGLQGKQRQLSLQWVGGRAAQETATVIDLNISGRGMKKKHALKNVYGVSNLNLPTQSLSESDISSNANCYQKLKLKAYANAVPKLLIGLDHCHLGLPTDVFKLNISGPFAANTELGWVVFGPTMKTAPTRSTCLLTSFSSDENLHSLVAEYFETESFGVRPSPPVESIADTRAKEILQSTTKKVDGKFQAGLLWSKDDVELPDSFSMAQKRLIGIERKMKQDVSYAAAYKAIMKKYISNNYARKLQPAEAAVTGPKTWYLPHFGVVNPNKPAKLRLVFDAAAKVKGISLNTFLLKGPQQYQPLPSILFHFREGAFAVCGDIREMFHQIIIQPEDRCAQRFLWRDADESRPPDIHEMVAMTFGAACSPCTAQYVKTINALEHQTHHPRAVKSIMEHHYVDDFVDSFQSEEEAIQISSQVRDIHSKAGFELRNFCSNSPKILNALEGTSTDVSLGDKCSLHTEKILGMYWQPATDNFKYYLKFHNVEKDVIAGERHPTKRELLSIIMSVFDPLGLLSQFTISAKLLMREVWRHDVRWDEELPSELVASWNMWRQKLPDVVEFSVPRFYFQVGTQKNVQVHVFVDASEDAFAAAAYWRVENAEGNVDTALICAKTKCAPMKLLTIPRLELQAAVLGARLLKTILDDHSIKVNRCILWSDSKTVLKWINSEHRRYKPFVAHRVAEILSSTKPSNWSWIPTQENVADEATRTNRDVDFSSTSRWLQGPAFLRQDEYRWPADTTADCIAADVEEISPKYSLMVVSEKFIAINRFSSLHRLVRTTAWVVRFVGKCRRQPSPHQQNGLTATEIESAEQLLCRLTQREAFSAELQQIDRHQAITKESALFKLSPYVDDKGLLRVRGRIDAASWLPHNVKRPIILPPNHDFTTLVVAHHHHKMKHQNIEATICEIRRQYWIPRLRQIMRKVISNCSTCKFSKAKPVTPIMGPLPEDRLTPFVRPFSYTGLDYFGPLTVTIGRRTEKRWVALFTCMVVRAIHLEVAYDLSTDACILAIRNFINRRGVPVKIRSDNGTNFVGADKEARRFSEVFDCARIRDELSSQRVEWVFNCPANPSEGGAWERMVQCVKRVLRHTLKESAPREHTLQCLVIEAENVVNSRPLTHLPVSADDEEPLTPNHFLLGTANTAQTPGVKEALEKTCALRKQWRIARHLRDSFWKRWIGEYLPTLTRRVKWCQRTQPIKEGDLVLVCDVNVPRLNWCRGRIEKVYPGADGEIRRADVRTSKGLMQRPVSKLAVLDI